jgi:isopenicillin N synthase-like dioxygenase
MSGIAPVSLTREAHDPMGFAAALGASFERYGFAVVADHGIDQSLLDRANAASRAFFALPEVDKRRYHLKGGGGARGYTPFGIETAKGADHYDLKEFWHVGRTLPPHHPYAAVMAPNVWPEELPEFKTAFLDLYAAFDAMSLRLMRAVARHLDLPPDFFAPALKDGNSVLRLLHYPPVPPDAGGIRAGAHEDINTITLLLGADEAGLQVLDRDGRWLPINPPAGTLVVNIGDMLQRETNHVLPSTSHRVVNPPPERRGIPRYSMPFFVHYAPDYIIRTLKNCVSADRPDRYPTPISSHDFLEERLREIGLK